MNTPRTGCDTRPRLFRFWRVVAIALVGLLCVGATAWALHSYIVTKTAVLLGVSGYSEDDPRSRSVLEIVQGTKRVRLGELSASSAYPGWVTYRYHDAAKGFEISFPPEWSITEHPVSATSSEVATIEVFRRPVGFNRVEVHVTDMDTPFGFGPSYHLEKIVDDYTPMATSLLGETALLFEEVLISYVDGGIPILGKVIYFPDLLILIRISERSSYQPDNDNTDLIDVDATHAVFDTFRFLK